MTQSKKYRSRTEIIYNILQTVRSEVKTKIMYDSFLSYYQVKEYLTILVDYGLLQYNSDIQKFRITEKGIKFLELCDQIDCFKEEQHPQIL